MCYAIGFTIDGQKRLMLLAYIDSKCLKFTQISLLWRNLYFCKPRYLLRHILYQLLLMNFLFRQLKQRRDETTYECYIHLKKQKRICAFGNLNQGFRQSLQLPRWSNKLSFQNPMTVIQGNSKILSKIVFQDMKICVDKVEKPSVSTLQYLPQRSGRNYNLNRR